jgi:Zn-dependent protease with chaperone function
MPRTRTSFGRDTGLQARMALTMLLLGAVYVGFVVLLLAAGVGATVMLLIVGGFAFAQLFLSDKIALSAMGAREVTPEEAPGLHAMIERSASRPTCRSRRSRWPTSRCRTPSRSGAPRRRRPSARPQGIMNTLSPAELEGVMAHELSHVKNRDVLIMTIASFFASVAAMITQFGFIFGGGMGGDDDEGGAGFLAVLLVSFTVYIISFFLMLALSRYREFSADRGAALVTGRPSALSSALIKISSQMEKVPQQDLRAAGEMNAFFIVPTSVKGAIQSIFSTHPPMDKRIERLGELERQLQAGASA